MGGGENLPFLQSPKGDVTFPLLCASTLLTLKLNLCFSVAQTLVSGASIKWFGAAWEPSWVSRSLSLDWDGTDEGALC